ncbi:SAM-dependent methyltransferase [Betaproteobacteria bacterium]|nr:SAM-dependent methyltransferase [Betaproteobacteria bacterium]GHU44974.1 SAM-dependent methyltransferase [Betaproteobacteria bacterium]
MPVAAQNFPTPAEINSDHGADLRLHACTYCGLVQIPGTPVPYYREVIRAAAYSPEMEAFRREQFADWIKQHHLRGKRLLEIGCGRGEYLHLLQAAGVETHGIEYSPLSVAACRQAGLSVSRAYLGKSSQRLRQARFDAFASFNFIEHWPDPVASLRGIRNNLEDHAIGLIEAPNFDMILRQGLYSEFISDHLAYFTADTLRYTLQTAGFEILDCRSIWHDYILSATVRKRPAVDLSLIHTRHEQIECALNAFLDRFPPQSVAVWGAGHQALAVIALAGIARRLRYVVDSAAFKQGKCTPATHLPIVPPSTLKSDPVQAVIVMAAGYSDEVVRIILDQYKHLALQVAVLRDNKLEIR